jgi:hypothetical protein
MIITLLSPFSSKYALEKGGRLRVVGLINYHQGSGKGEKTHAICIIIYYQGEHVLTRSDKGEKVHTICGTIYQGE